MDTADVAEVSVPTHRELQWPTLQAVEEIGGSGTIQEIDQKVIEREGFTEEQLEERQKRGEQLTEQEQALLEQGFLVPP